LPSGDVARDRAGLATSKTWYPDLAVFLPKDLPLARLMARLFVLWQDMLYEHAGLIEDAGFGGLDQRGHGDLQRRLYFLRGNSRTLSSAKYLFDALVIDSTFSSWLREDAGLSKGFFEAKSAFDKHRSVIEQVRNTIGAHGEQDMGDAIEEFQVGDRGRFETHSADVMVASGVTFAIRPVPLFSAATCGAASTVRRADRSTAAAGTRACAADS